MAIDRKLLLEKLIGFLTGGISKNEIYEWALFIAVSKDYEELIKNDKLSEQVLKFLLDIDKPRTTATPTKKILEYFIACLNGQQDFTEQAYQALISAQAGKSAGFGKSVAAKSQESDQKSDSTSLQTTEKKPVRFPWISFVARIYIWLFVCASLILNITAILMPDFLVKEDQIAPIPDDVLRDAFPHLFYGLTMMIALLIRGPKFLFYLLFFVATWGMFFYWYSVTVFVFQNKWPLYYVVMLSPVLTIPPTMMFCLMLAKWFQMVRR